MNILKAGLEEQAAFLKDLKDMNTNNTKESVVRLSFELLNYLLEDNSNEVINKSYSTFFEKEGEIELDKKQKVRHLKNILEHTLKNYIPHSHRNDYYGLNLEKTLEQIKKVFVVANYYKEEAENGIK